MNQRNSVFNDSKRKHFMIYQFCISACPIRFTDNHSLTWIFLRLLFVQSVCDKNECKTFLLQLFCSRCVYLMMGIFGATLFWSRTIQRTDFLFHRIFFFFGLFAQRTWNIRSYLWEPGKIRRDIAMPHLIISIFVFSYFFSSISLVPSPSPSHFILLMLFSVC